MLSNLIYDIVTFRPLKKYNKLGPAYKPNNPLAHFYKKLMPTHSPATLNLSVSPLRPHPPTPSPRSSCR
jgi:hypothetical protein